MKAKTRSLLEAAEKPRRTGALIFSALDTLPQAEQCLKLIRRHDTLKAQLTEAKAIVASAIQAWREQQPSYDPCVVIPIGDVGTLQVLFKQQWHKIPSQKEAELRAELGEAFDDSFREQVTLKVRKDVTDDPKKLEQIVLALANAVGPEQFAAWFEVERTWVPTATFAEDPPIDLATRVRLGITQTIVVDEKG